MEKVKWPIPNIPYPLWWKFSSSIAIIAVGSISKLWLCYLNSTKVYRQEILRNAVTNRPNKVGLITVSNHHSCVDDPLFNGVLSWKTLLDPSKARWSLAAHDVCFTKKWHGFIMGLGQTIPVIRGDGVYQYVMNFSLHQMNLGNWVHIFPEGQVNMDKLFMRLKWGVGRLISECQNNALVVPFYHLGIDDILPNKRPYIPRIGKKVTIVIGEPLDFGPLMQVYKKLKYSPLQKRKYITDVIQEKLNKLKEEAIELHNAR